MILAMPAPQTDSRRLSRLYRHLALWVLQSWLAMFFIAAGYAKLTQPQEILAVLMVWPADASEGAIQLIGCVELALAVGMVSPLLSWRLFLRLMLIACVGLTVEATLMAIYHAANQHLGLALVNVALALMGAMVIRCRKREAADAHGPGLGTPRT